MNEFHIGHPGQEETDWRAHLTIIAYGVALRVRTNEPELMASLIEYLPPDWRATKRRPEVVYSLNVGKRAGQRYSLFCDDSLRFQTSRLSRVFEHFEASVQHYVAEMSPNKVFVHAGVVGWRGRAILIPGRSYSGKTTMVKELVRLGAVYYSDEYAVLDERGRVHPYARPLVVRRKGTPGQKRIRAESLGAMIGAKPLPVSLVVFSRFREDARWRPGRLTAGKGALEILNQTIPARREPHRAMLAIGQVVSNAVVIKSTRGEVKPVTRLLLAYLEQLEPRHGRPA